MQYDVYLVLAPIAGIFSIAAVILAWHGRKVAGFQSLIWLLISISGFLFSNLFEFLSPSEAGTVFWARASYLFVGSLPVLWIAFALEYTGRVFWLKMSRFWVFCLIPIATLAFIFYDPFLHLIWQNYTYTPAGNYFHVVKVLEYGPWFWVFVVYDYGLVLSGAALVMWAYFRSNSVYRRQSHWIVIGSVLPLLANLIYTFRLIPGLTKDFSPIAYTFAGLCFTIDVHRHLLLDVMPIARSTLFDRMSDGVVVVDARHRIIDVNAAAIVFFGQERDRILGSQVSDHAPFWDAQNLPGKDEERIVEVVSQQNGRRLFFEVRILSLVNNSGVANGYLIAIHENTRDKELLEQVEKLASIDPLTDVYNRRSLIELADREIQDSARQARPVSVIMVDLDKFKEINDHSGHMVGDQVLVQVAHHLQANLRSTDKVARFGGDEFLIFLANTTQAEALPIAERLRAEIEQFQLPYNCTVSMGIATLDPVAGEATLDELFERADQALYCSKLNGGNNVSVYS